MMQISMSSSSRMVYVIAILSLLLTRGMCLTCSYKDLMLSQTATGSRVSGKAEYLVEIFNACGCTHSNIELDCRGFKILEPTDPAALKLIGNTCVVAADEAFVPPFQGTSFTYVWDSIFPFNVIASSPNCTDTLS